MWCIGQAKILTYVFMKPRTYLKWSQIEYFVGTFERREEEAWRITPCDVLQHHLT